MSLALAGVVETVEDRSIHFLDALKRSITVADYVAMTEMKICRKPYVRHLSCELLGDLVQRETPRLCRGGSRSLTDTGVHRGNSQT
jgi:hypothetical protein